MNARFVPLAWISTGVLALAPCFVAAAEPAAEPAAGAPPAEEPFLSDYSKLKPAPDNPFDEIYISPDAAKHASKYTAVMIDQPELFIHPDSPYKGMKPDDLKVIADQLRNDVSAELKSGYQIVDQPGPNVMYVRLAIGDLSLKKKKRPILAYTPIGAVVHAAKNAMVDVTSKIDLKNAKIEGEVLDSTTQEQLGAITATRGSLSTNKGDPTRPVEWKELDHMFSSIGKRLRCRLDNSHVADAAQKQNCGAIGLEAPGTDTAKETKTAETDEKAE